MKQINLKDIDKSVELVINKEIYVYVLDVLIAGVIPAVHQRSMVRANSIVNAGIFY